MVNVGQLTAEIGVGVLGTPANFSGFRVLASLLHRRRSTEVNHQHFARCLAISWVSTLSMHLGGSCSLMEFCQVQNCVILYWQRYCTARHSSSGRQPNFAACIFTRQGCHPVRHWAVELSSSQSSHHRLPSGLKTDSTDFTTGPVDFTTGPFLLSISVFVFSFFITVFCLVPCGRLSWFLVSFWAQRTLI